MPRYDLYHNTVKNALVKDGWIITDDPYVIEFKGLRSV
ncbi:MAG: element excision factor XisH family protein, partial [Xenococcus sp. (in: cyanobacteria)]